MDSPAPTINQFSSSSPLSDSTAPSSVTKDSISKGPLETMQIDDCSSDVEILEERNGSPQPPKRKAKDDMDVDLKSKSTSSKSENKPTTSKKPASSTKASAAPKASGKEKEKEKAASGSELVELKNGKLVLKQKGLTWDKASMVQQASMAFTEYLKNLFSDSTAKLEEWPVEHQAYIAHLTHESDKALNSLARVIKSEVVKIADGAGPIEEESQEDVASAKKGSANSQRISHKAVEAIIENVATRTNYGLEASDLPDGLPDGVTEIPATLQLWRWEVNSLDLMPPEFEVALSKRQTSRVSAKSQAVELFLSLPDDERLSLLNKPSIANNKRSRVADESSAPVASGSGTSTPAAPKKKKVKAEETDEEKAAKLEKEKLKEDRERVRLEREKMKEEREKEKEEKRIAREKAAAEKEEKKAEQDEKKAKSDEKKKLKKAAEDKKEAETKKAASFMNMFVKKTERSASPVIVSASSSTPKGGKSSGESDFDRVFRPFHIKTDVTLAPTNRFRKRSSGKAPELGINSAPDLTAKEGLDAFLSGIPRKHVLRYNPHPTPALSVREAVRAIYDSSMTGEDASVYQEALANRKKVQVKLLKFKEDVRPGWQGTWTKSSSIVGPRTPFAMDTTLLRYDYDSEDEWEEEEVDPDADDINSGGEKSDDDGSRTDGSLSDDWMCDDDEVEFEEGHEDADEFPMDVDQDDDLIIMDDARRKIQDREKKSKAARDGAKKKKLVGPLVPTVKGPYWEKKVGQVEYAPFAPMRIQFLNDAPVNLDPFKWISKPFATPLAVAKAKVVDDPSQSSATASTSTAPPPGVTGTGLAAKSTKVKRFPAELIPDFVQLVEGSNRNRLGLIDDIQLHLPPDATGKKVAKATIDQALKDLAKKGKAAEGGKWSVDHDKAKALMAMGSST